LLCGPFAAGAAHAFVLAWQVSVVIVFLRRRSANEGRRQMRQPLRDPPFTDGQQPEPLGQVKPGVRLTDA
jgi:hypothetical protein